jgi:hypothetical protein
VRLGGWILSQTRKWSFVLYTMGAGAALQQCGSGAAYAVNARAAQATPTKALGLRALVVVQKLALAQPHEDYRVNRSQPSWVAARRLGALHRVCPGLLALCIVLVGVQSPPLVPRDRPGRRRPGRRLDLGRHRRRGPGRRRALLGDRLGRGLCLGRRRLGRRRRRGLVGRRVLLGGRLGRGLRLRLGRRRGRGRGRRRRGVPGTLAGYVLLRPLGVLGLGGAVPTLCVSRVFRPRGIGMASVC